MTALQVGKTYDITDRMTVKEDRGGGEYKLVTASGDEVYGQMSGSAKAVEVLTEPPVGSLVVDNDGDYYVRTAEGWQYIIGRELSTVHEWTWDQLSDAAERGDGPFPVAVVYEAGQ